MLKPMVKALIDLLSTRLINGHGTADGIRDVASIWPQRLDGILQFGPLRNDGLAMTVGQCENNVGAFCQAAGHRLAAMR